MKKLLRGFGPATLSVLMLTASAAAQNYPPPGYPPQAYPPPPPGYSAPRYGGPAYPASPAQASPTQPQQASNPVCVRLESQLAAIDSSANNTARADQVRRAEDAIARQQSDLDRTLAHARRSGCEGEGFFSLFSGFSPQCGPLTSQIQQMRGNLDRLMSDLEQIKSGNSGQQGQRAVLVGQLAQNNCGAQYTAAARASGPQGFFEALLGNGTVVSPSNDGAPAGTYRTVCVRSCDGFYFPVSYSTVPNRFADDERTCQRLCPAAEVSLYTYHNPGEQIDQAVSTNGQLYTALPNAFHYRKELVAGCSCRRAGESWAEALHNADDNTTLESGDILVTEKNAKTLSQPQGPAAKAPLAPGTQPAADSTPGPAAPDNDSASGSADPAKRKVRVVGPPFVSDH